MNKNITVLYVDDEEINLTLFELSFNKTYKILTASSGEEGLLKLESHKDDIIVVISDMRMPEMDGVDFIYKAKEKYANIAYFILTGFDYNDKIDVAMKVGVIHKFFTKPFDIDEIQEAISDVIIELNLTSRFKKN